ncbi:hypothetical protein GGI12_001616 [Dipsacomyces acuminosporus]|nr:hypothetical protein GGI12_001616 [Dipsacomyces acuminosporus]
MAGGDLTGTLAWLFLPQFASSCVLKAAHWILQRAAPRLVPHPNTDKYALHQRISYVFVIAVYLVYTMWDTEAKLGSNYYQLLNVSPTAFSQHDLKRNFRQLSLALHPDKNPGGHVQFIQVQDAYNVLSSPVLRRVYDRAGVAGVDCKTCSSASDYLLSAIPQRIGIYLAFIVGSVAMQVFRIGKHGTYWRYVAIGAFAALELAMLTSSTMPALVRTMQWVAPHRTGHEISQILQQALVCFFIALNQIGPQFIPQERNVSTVALAKELLQSIHATNAEIAGKASRMADMFKNTGLQRPMAEEFAKELQLGMTLGSSQEFRQKYTERLSTERLKVD